MSRILIFGTGSIGTVYAYVLLQAGSEVVCVCRSNYEIAQSDGFRIKSTIFGEHVFRPTVVRSVSEAAELSPRSFDFIVVCTKANSGAAPETASLLSPAIKDETTGIVVIQNGLGVEDEFKTAFPSNPVVSGVAYLPSTQVSTGVVTHSEMERLHLGAYPTPASPDGQRAVSSFARLIKAGGATALIHDDVQVERWKKVVANGTWNPICALSRCRDVEFLQAVPLAYDFVKRAMNEVCAIAAAPGYSQYVNEEIVEYQLSRSKARAYPGVEPSMMADMRLRRNMEVEAVIGHMVKLGKKHGVDVPRLESLYVLLAGLNFALQKETASTAQL